MNKNLLVFNFIFLMLIIHLVFNKIIIDFVLGSVIILLKGYMGTVLHTGDMRFTPKWF